MINYATLQMKISAFIILCDLIYRGFS